MRNFFLKPKALNNTVFIGVTGFSGKTVVTEMIAHVLYTCGFSTLRISSNGIFFNGKKILENLNSSNISRRQFAKIFASNVENPPQYAVIEMDAEAIEKNKFRMISLDSGVIANTKFTDVATSTKEQQMRVQFNFLKSIKNEGLIVINGEDEDAKSWLSDQSQKLVQNIYCYWIDTGQIRNKEGSLQMARFVYEDNLHLESLMAGHYSFVNMYLAAKLCSRYVPIEQIQNALRSFRSVKGRFDITRTYPYTVVVDYARLPHVAKNSLYYLRANKHPTKRIISVAGVSENNIDNMVGVGSQMAYMADITILAPLDPNNTLTDKLNSLMLNSAEHFGGKPVERFKTPNHFNNYNLKDLKERSLGLLLMGEKPIIAFDYHNYLGRLDAIQCAIAIANPGDIIYINGKGDERFLIFDDVEYEWSEADAIDMAFNKLQNDSKQ